MSAAAIRGMLAAGLTIDQALLALEAIESAQAAKKDAALEKKRAQGAARQRSYKARQKLNDAADAADALPASPSADPYIARADAPVCSNDISNEISKLDNPQSPTGITPTEKPKRAHRLPEDWVLPDDWREAALRKGLSDSEATRQAERMLNWSRSAKNGAKLDWRRTWLNWIDDAPRANARAGPSPERDYGKGALAKLIRNVDESLKNERLGQAQGEISGGNVLSLPVVPGVRGGSHDDDGDVSPFAQWLRPGSG